MDNPYLNNMQLFLCEYFVDLMLVDKLSEGEEDIVDLTSDDMDIISLSGTNQNNTKKATGSKELKNEEIPSPVEDPKSTTTVSGKAFDDVASASEIYQRLKAKSKNKTKVYLGWQILKIKNWYNVNESKLHKISLGHHT